MPCALPHVLLLYPRSYRCEKGDVSEWGAGVGGGLLGGVCPGLTLTSPSPQQSSVDRARLPSTETPRCPLAPWRRGSWNTWMGTRCRQKQGPAPALSPGDPQDRQAPAELCRAAWGVIGSGRGPGPCAYEKPQPQPPERGVVPPRLRPWHVGTRVQKHTFNDA